MDKVEGLISVLLDPSARIDERDDAAMDLGNYDDDRSLSALLSVALDLEEDQMVVDSCGESIAEIWIKRDFFDPIVFKKLHPQAQFVIYRFARKFKPDWVNTFTVLSAKES